MKYKSRGETTNFRPWSGLPDKPESLSAVLDQSQSIQTINASRSRITVRFTAPGNKTCFHHCEVSVIKTTLSGPEQQSLRQLKHLYTQTCMSALVWSGLQSGSTVNTGTTSVQTPSYNIEHQCCGYSPQRPEFLIHTYTTQDITDVNLHTNVIRPEFFCQQTWQDRNRISCLSAFIGPTQRPQVTEDEFNKKRV